jgi:hypothetical protein
MVIHYYYSFPTTSFEDTVLATPGRRRPISYRFGSVISVPGPPKPISLCYRFGWQTKPRTDPSFYNFHPYCRFWMRKNL